MRNVFCLVVVMASVALGAGATVSLAAGDAHSTPAVSAADGVPATVVVTPRPRPAEAATHAVTPTPAPTTPTATATPKASLTSGTWTTDFEAAKNAAAEQNKRILLFFTGSDWCPWCIRLNQEVFSQKAFKDYVASRFVLVVADFPRKTQLSARLKAQNDRLASTYGIEGYPTVLILDATGRKIHETGYRAGGAESWVKNLDRALPAPRPPAPISSPTPASVAPPAN